MVQEDKVFVSSLLHCFANISFHFLVSHHNVHYKLQKIIVHGHNQDFSRGGGGDLHCV